jgi:site-specific recombinase XerD
MNPEAVKLTIANWINQNGTPASEQRKHKFVWDYDYFVKSNNLQWTRPKYNNDSPPPITPSIEQAEAIIKFAPSTSSLTIFQILLETGFEGEELHCTTSKNIDIEQGIISVEGHKEHTSRAYTLSKQTTALLKHS